MRLATIFVREIMTEPSRSELQPDEEFVRTETSVEDTLRLMLSARLDLLAVVDQQDSICGMVTTDAMLALCEEWAAEILESAGSLMTRALITGTIETSISEAIDLMTTADIHHLPVVDSQGRLKTIVSLRDLTAFQTVTEGGGSTEVPEGCLEEFEGGEVWTATSGTSIRDAVRTLRDNRFGCLPIVEDEHLLGILTESDILRTFLRSNGEQDIIARTSVLIRDYMNVDSPTVSPDDFVQRAVALFVELNPSTLLVVEHGTPVGVLSRSDLMHCLHVPRFCEIDGLRARLLERPISELMTRGVLSIDASSAVGEAGKFLGQQGVHSLIVFDDGEPVGTFGPHEVLRAVGSLRTGAQLQDIMSNVVFELDCRETLRSGLRFLDSAGLRGLIVRDGEHSVGVFGQHEALAAASLHLDTPVESVMSTRILCLPGNMPSFRAAQQAGALGIEQILVTSPDKNNGLVSASDFFHLLAQS